MSVERGKDIRVCADESTFGTIASCEVLRGDNGHGLHRVGIGNQGLGIGITRIPGFSSLVPDCSNEQYLAVIICKVGAFYNLCDERPKFQRLVRSLMVENKVYTRNFLVLADKEQAAEKFFGNGKRSLPNFRYADL